MPDDIKPPFEVIQRLTRDLRAAAIMLGDEEARFLVDAYYIVQEDRKRSFSQKRELEKDSEPNEVITWFAHQNETLEDQIKAALDAYTSNHMMGSWMRAIYGIGPVLSAGLLAHIDMNKAPTVGHIWQYAGVAGRVADTTTMRAVYHVTYPYEVDPNHPPRLPIADKSANWAAEATYLYPDGETAGFYQLTVPGDTKKPPAVLIHDGVEVVALLKVISGQTPWKKGTKRPFNAQLKTLLWKCGQSFMKFSNREECLYGHLYRERKLIEVERNEAGLFADQAAEKLAFLKSKTTDAYTYYSQGKLPPGHIDARARRYAVKIFISHLHAEWYRRYFGKEPPKPFAIGILGHAHMIEPN